jgi:hypothetical protein
MIAFILNFWYAAIKYAEMKPHVKHSKQMEL